MTILQIGSKVRYRSYMTEKLHGKEGVITRPGPPDSPNGRSWYVRFVGEANEWSVALMENNLEPVYDGLKAGDRVAYVGNPNQASGGEEQGWHGTVTGFVDGNGYVKVRWDKYAYAKDYEFHGYPKDGNELLKLDDSVQPPTEAWVYAYNLLERLGDVHFTIKPLPFDAINCGYINANEDYQAVVYGDSIKVGCQRISFEKFDEIAAAVAKAREWQKRKPQTFTNMPQAPAVQS